MTIKTLEQTQTSSHFPHISEEQLVLLHHTRPDSDITDDVRRVLQADTILRATADQIEILALLQTLIKHVKTTTCPNDKAAMFELRD